MVRCWKFPGRRPAVESCGVDARIISEKFFSYLRLLAAVRTRLSIIHQKAHFEQ